MSSDAESISSKSKSDSSQEEKDKSSSKDSGDSKMNAKSLFASKFSFNLFSNNKEDEESNQKLMADKVLNQNDVDEKAQEDDVIEGAKHDSTDNKEAKLDVWSSIAKLMTGGKDANMDTVIEITSTALAQQEGELSDTKSTLSAEDFKVVMQKVYEQVKGNFEDVPIDKIDPLAFLYYLEGEDARKNPSWKRRLHRFMPSIKMETVYGLHDALYLAQLAYVDTVEDIQTGLDNYVGAKYELVYCTTEGKPRQPAHFIVIKKEGRIPDVDPNSAKSDGNEEKGSIFPTFSKTKTYIEVVLVVRGTKTLEDMFSDAMLEASPYRDGCAHDGVCQSGRYLVEKHTDLILQILKMSGRDKVKLTLLGHSLGAGAAAIACIEFNNNDKIEASCIGFGCPALVNREMSEQWKDKIITVVSDSDCVSRMSGATGKLVNRMRCLSCPRHTHVPSLSQRFLLL
jgi:Lipase (class 3)